MPRASILINGAPSSLLDAPIGAVVNLDNDGIGDETTYSWSIVDQPEGTADALSDPNIQNPTFTASKEGTYLIKLIVDQGLGTEVINQKVCGVLQLKTGKRIPASTETTEANASQGWGPEVGQWLQLLDARSANPGVIVAEANAGLTRGMPAWVAGTAMLKTGLPGEETLPLCDQARGNQLTELTGSVGIVESQINGDPTVAPGDLALIRMVGLIGPFTGPLLLGDTVFVSDAGAINNAAGTFPRAIGMVVADAAGDYWIFVDGTGFPGAMHPPDPDRRDAPAVLAFGNSTTPAAPGTTYLSPWWNSVVSGGTEVSFRAPYAGVLSDLYLQSRVAPNGDDADVVIRINGADTSIAAVMSAGAFRGKDVGNSEEIAAGDEISASLTLGVLIAAGPSSLTATLKLIRS